MFLLTAAFVGFSGYSLTRAWFMRLDDFDSGLPGHAAPSSSLLTELRQRQLVAVLTRGSCYVRAEGQAGCSRQSGSADGSGSEVGPACELDLDVIDRMYERAMTGPFCGPLLRLFLADYIRWDCVFLTFIQHWGYSLTQRQVDRYFAIWCFLCEIRLSVTSRNDGRGGASETAMLGLWREGGAGHLLLTGMHVLECRC
jgi:hypothetical protein